MLNSNISLLVFGNPVNYQGFQVKSFGFVAEENIDLKRYLDFNRDYMPSSKNEEIYRIVRFAYKNTPLTLFSSYRLINPNDVEYNRGNYIAFGFVLKGAVKFSVSSVILSTLSELHGYLVRYIDLEKNTLKKGISINTIEVKVPPFLSKIVTERNDGNIINNKVEESYAILDVDTELASLLSVVSFGFSGLESLDVVIFSTDREFKGRNKININSINAKDQQFPLTEKLLYNHPFEKTSTVQIKKGILTDYAEKTPSSPC